MKIVIFNGPPYSGKDTACKYIADALHDYGCIHVKMSTPLKTITSKCLIEEHDRLEEVKDEPIFAGGSYRQLQIQTFEKLSEVFGDDWLGKYFVSEMKDNDAEYAVLSDGGRYGDLLPLVNAYGNDNIMIIQVQRDGCSFQGDIRSYITMQNVRTIPIFNDDIDAFRQQCYMIASDFFAES